MLGIRYIKFDPMTYVIKFKNGNAVKEGRGLSFYYFTHNTSITAIPLGSNNLPFIFSEITKDYQTITVQGQITYKVSNPKNLSELLDFTVDHKGVLKKDNTEKITQTLINEAQTSATSLIRELGLKEAIRAGKDVEKQITDLLSKSKPISILGIEILSINILAIKAAPQMERAFETETREKVQQEADQAIYDRRNFAIEQERRIKENELNTEISVEEKKKQITEKKMEAEIQHAENERKLREMKVQADISIENYRKQLIDQKNENDRKEAETKGYVIEETLKPYKEMDWKILNALTNNNDPKSNIALAFRELAENAGKIGTLNITPELLDSILK